MTDSLSAAYASAASILGDFAATVDLGAGPTLPGRDLTDPGWLADRVAATGRRWQCTDDRTAGTLWWYSTSSTLVAAPTAMLLTTGLAPDPDPDRLRISLQDNGHLSAARSDRLLDSAEDFRDAARATFDAIITPLAAVSGAAPRALWAIASDSIATRALGVGTGIGRVDAGCAVAAAIAAAPLLPPRYVDLTGPSGTRRFVRRSSCCLIYEVPGCGTCSSCPRRTPADREAILRRYMTD